MVKMDLFRSANKAEADTVSFLEVVQMRRRVQLYTLRRQVLKTLIHEK